MDIRPCDACDACRKDMQADCILNDGMQEIYPELRRADALVIATPVYWFTVTAQTKLFLDRCYALLGPPGSGSVLKGKKVGIVMTYGDADPFISGAVNALRTFQDAFNYVGAQVVGMVYGSADKVGEMATQPDLLEKAFRLGGQLATET
jgi:multimeric flavodoxin WrbA